MYRLLSYEPKWFSKGLHATTNMLDQYSLIQEDSFQSVLLNESAQNDSLLVFNQLDHYEITSSQKKSMFACLKH